MGLVLYLLLAAVGVGAGQALVRTLAPRIDRRGALYLAPVTTLAVWTVMLGLAVTAGLPLKRVWLVVWVVTLILAATQVTRGNWRAIKSEALPLGLALALPVALMAPYFRHGLLEYLGSHHHDGWSYIAYGQYLWEYPRGTEGGLAPLHQYAAHLSTIRFTASAMLAFLSPLTGVPGDTRAASGLLLAWSVLALVLATLFFGRAYSLPRSRRLGLALVVGLSGWVLNVLWANNYDNALALGYLPALAGAIALVDPVAWRWAAVLAILAAGIAYTYPEMAGVVLATAGLFALERVWRERGQWRAWLILIALSALAGAVLVAPFARQMVVFALGQIGAAVHTGVRPGEGLFTDLLVPRRLPGAWWGLGIDEFVVFPGLRKALARWASPLGMLLWAVAAIGLVDLVRRRRLALAGSVLALAGAAWFMILGSRYSYGAYKFIVVNWPGLCVATLTGVDAVLRARILRRVRPGLVTGALALLGLYLAASVGRIVAFDAALGRDSAWRYSRVRAVAAIVKDEPLVVAVDDDVANEWAVYFLRDVRTYLAEYRAYMAQAHVVPLMERAAPVDLSRVRYVLTDSAASFTDRRPVWRRGPYVLWKLPPGAWAFVTSIRNANGVEEWAGERSFWLGNGDTELRVLASRSGPALVVTELGRGPSLDRETPGRLELLTGQGYQTTISVARTGWYRLCLPLVEGRNRLVLRALDAPAATGRVAGDPRIMPIGVRGLRLVVEGAAACADPGRQG